MQESMDFTQAGILNSLVSDYISGKDTIRQFINQFPDLEGLNEIAKIREKQLGHPRALLAGALKQQYKSQVNTEIAQTQMDKLLLPNTFTVTTGHQLCLATGPLYMIYKVLHTIKLAEELNKQWPNRHIVPIFWMATEDHDFEEINHVQIFGKKITWNSEQNGGVGRFNLDDFSEVMEEITSILGTHENAEAIKAWLEKAYTSVNLAEAMRSLIHDLFGQQGLVIVDGDDPALKSLFKPILKREIFEGGVFEKVESTIKELNGLSYHQQANPREINVFLLDEKGRERLIAEGNDFKGADSGRKFSASEIEETIENHPEKFSPNVLMRPMYQECILPNLCYIGGGGEIAYWLQLKSAFEHFGLVYPAVMVRNSMVLLDPKSADRMDKMNLHVESLFGDVEAFISQWTAEEASIDLTNEKKKMSAIYAELKPQAEAIDPTLGKFILAEEQKQLNTLENLEKKLIKAAKNSQEIEINQIRKLHEKFFPNGSFQERKLNIIEFWLNNGPQIFEEIKEQMDPLNPKVNILKLT